MAYLGTKPANQVIDSTLIADGTITPADLSTGKPVWDTSGNLGVGTSSPSTKLNVFGSSPSIYLQQDGGVAGNTQLRLNAAGGSNTGSVRLLDKYIWASTSNGSQLNIGNDLTTAQMILDSSGNLLVNTTSLATPGGAPGKMEVKANAGAGFQWASVFNNATTTSASVIGVSITYTGAAPNGTGNEFLYCIDTSAVRATIRSNGGIANYSANNVNISDAREKTNVELAGSYLDKICAIPVKTFNYIDQNRDEDDGLTLGVIAQDVEAVAPELVMESNWGSIEEPKMRLSIYQTDLQYALMKCIQEQQAIITEQASTIAAFEARLTALEAK